HVVPEQVAVRRAVGQPRGRARGGEGDLFIQRASQQRGLAVIQERRQGRCGGFPPVQSAQVGLVNGKVLRGQVGLRQGPASQGAVGRAGFGLVAARQPCDDGGRFAVQGGQASAVKQGLGFGYGHP